MWFFLFSINGLQLASVRIFSSCTVLQDGCCLRCIFRCLWPNEMNEKRNFLWYLVELCSILICTPNFQAVPNLFDRLKVKKYNPVIFPTFAFLPLVWKSCHDFLHRPHSVCHSMIVAGASAFPLFALSKCCRRDPLQ